MKPLRTHYDNLQVAENASQEVIKGAYKYLCQKWHPDKNPRNRAKAERISCIINAAYTVLSDPKRRKDHDEWIQTQREEGRKYQSRDNAPSAPQPTVNSGTQEQQEPSREIVICPNCQSAVKPRKESKGSTLVMLVLLLLFIVPGMIYGLFRGGYKHVCPKCGHTLAESPD